MCMFVWVRMKSSLFPYCFAICFIGRSVRYKCTESWSNPSGPPCFLCFVLLHRAIFCTFVFYSELFEEPLNSMWTATQVDKTAVCAVLTRISGIHWGKTGKSPGCEWVREWVMRDRLPQHRSRQYCQWMSYQHRCGGQSLQVSAWRLGTLMVFIFLFMQQTLLFTSEWGGKYSYT